MGENGGNSFTNWGLLPSQMTHLSSHLDLQLMPSTTHDDALYGGGGGTILHLSLPQQHELIHQLRPSCVAAASMIGGPYHHQQRFGGLFSDASIQTNNYVWGDSCLSRRPEKILNVFPNHHNQNQQSELDYGVMPESSLVHPGVHYIQHPGNLWKNDITSTDRMHVFEETDVLRQANKRGTGGISTDRMHVFEETDVLRQANKRGTGGIGKAPKSTKTKKQKMDPNAAGEEYTRVANRARAPKKSVQVIINGISMDISGIPVPVCTCTGTPQPCYRWGVGGWQSACCTTSLSKFPLPMSAKRRGARIPGRKMSFGAFKKVLEKVSSEGHDIANPIDLVTHWAKHGTNKFVTIR